MHVKCIITDQTRPGKAIETIFSSPESWHRLKKWMPKDPDGDANWKLEGKWRSSWKKQLESLDQKEQKPTWTALAVGRS